MKDKTDLQNIKNRQIDIVCVYNNEKLYNQMVKSTKGCKDLKVNIIGLDNRDGKYSSAAYAYNYAIDNFCVSQVLIFCHQDIVWKSKAINKIYDICVAETNTLYGSAGVLNDGNKHKKPNPIMYQRYRTLAENEIKNVFTLDEQMLAGNKQVFKKVRFDPKTCYGWYFYGVDLCLQCHLKGINVAVVGLDIQHLSNGSITKEYIKHQQLIATKYQWHFLKISTPCGWFYTREIFDMIHNFFKKILSKIKIN